MTKDRFFRQVYMRIQGDDGKRRWVTIGYIDRQGVFRLYKSEWKAISDQAWLWDYER